MTTKPTVCSSIPKRNSTWKKMVSLKSLLSTTKLRFAFMGKPTCCNWAHSGFSEIERFLFHFQQEGQGPFFFAKSTVTGMSNLDIMQAWLMQQNEDEWWLIYQHDGDPPHYSHLNQYLPQCWIGRTTTEGHALLRWPRSPGLTPWDFSLWGYVKDSVFLPPLPQDLPELRRRIIAATSEIDRNNMLQGVWAEMYYRLDICIVTDSEHIEHLWSMQKKKKKINK